MLPGEESGKVRAAVIYGPGEQKEIKSFTGTKKGRPNWPTFITGIKPVLPKV